MNKSELQKLLLREECEVLHAYPDSLGFLTIGVGHLIDGRNGGGISPKISRMILDDDMSEKFDQLTRAIPWAVNLDDVRCNTLVAMTFQLGIDGLLKFKNFLTHLRDRDFDSAAAEMLNSKWAKQTPDRAHRMAERIRTGVSEYA